MPDVSVSLSLAVAETSFATTLADFVIADTAQVTSSLECLLSDAAPIVLEPNDPRQAPLVTVADLVPTSHPNGVTSPTTDFATLGVVAGDVLEIQTGVNRGNYLVQSAQANTVFVSEALLDNSTAVAATAVIRQRVRIVASLKCGLVLDQALFLASFVRTARLDVAVD
jgi:hypothetical protein